MINANPMNFVMTNLWVVEWRVVLGKLFRYISKYILILIHFRECKVKQPKSSLVEGKVCRFDGHCEEGEYCERYITPFIGHCTSKLSDANLPQCYCKYLSDCGNFGCGTWCDTATKMCTVWPWKKWLYKTSWKYKKSYIFCLFWYTIPTTRNQCWTGVTAMFLTLFITFAFITNFWWWSTFPKIIETI